MTARSAPGQGSVPFDRIAHDYDRTRSLPPETAARVTEILRAELGALGRCLEVGVGTGRIALPLRAAGVRVAGVDLSEPMLRELAAKAAGGPAVPVARADAVRLPFRRAAFGSALLVHVLHLIGRWREALAEAVRTVRPGGVVVADVATWGLPWGRELQERFAREAGLPLRQPGANEPDEVDEAMAALGATARDLPEVVVHRTWTVRTYVERLRAGTYSFTWPAGEEARNRAAEAVLPWAERRLGSLDEPRSASYPLRWRAYDLRGA